MLKVDIHTHILPPEIPAFKKKFGYGGFIELIHQQGCCDADMVDDSGNFFRKVHSNCFDPKCPNSRLRSPKSRYTSTLNRACDVFILDETTRWVLLFQNI